MIVVCLIGLNAAGKDTIADILEEKGFKTLSCGDVLRKMAKDQGKPPEQELLLAMTEPLKRELGEGFLGKMLLDEFKEKEWEKCVANGLRRWGEWEELKKADKAIMILVDAPEDIRFDRAVKRSRDGDKLDRDAFNQYDKKLASIGLEKLKAEADYIIDNSGSMEELRQLVFDLLPKIC
jgi:dephospho-CoA kinase